MEPNLTLRSGIGKNKGGFIFLYQLQDLGSDVSPNVLAMEIVPCFWGELT